MLKNEEMPVYFTDEELGKIHKKHNKLPDPFVSQQKKPTVEQQEDIVKMLAYNGLWMVLTYGGGLLDKVAPWLGYGFKQIIKWRFKGQWEQKDLVEELSL